MGEQVDELERSIVDLLNGKYDDSMLVDKTDTDEQVDAVVSVSSPNQQKDMFINEAADDDREELKQSRAELEPIVCSEVLKSDSLPGMEHSTHTITSSQTSLKQSSDEISGQKSLVFPLQNQESQENVSSSNQLSLSDLLPAPEIEAAVIAQLEHQTEWIDSNPLQKAADSTEFGQPESEKASKQSLEQQPQLQFDTNDYKNEEYEQSTSEPMFSQVAADQQLKTVNVMPQ